MGSVRRIAEKSWLEKSVFVSPFSSLSLAWPEDKVVLDITRGTGEDQVATAIMVAQATTLAIVATMAIVVQTTTAIMVGPVIILAGEVITMVVDLITMVAITLADLTIIMATMGAQATTLEVAEVVLITTGAMVGQGTTLAATATMEVVGLITTGTTMEVLDTTPADLITMATTAMVGAVTTQGNRPSGRVGNPGPETNWKVVGPIVGVVAVVVVAVLVIGGICVAKRRYRGVPQSDL